MKWPKWVEQPPPMPAWYWAVYWTMPIVGVFVFVIGWKYHFLTALYLGLWYLVLIPLMYKKATQRDQHRGAVYLVLFFVAWQR